MSTATEHQSDVLPASFVDPDVLHDLLTIGLRLKTETTLASAVHAGLWGGAPPRPGFELAHPSPSVLTLNRGLGWTFTMFDRGDAMDVAPIYRGPARRYIDLAVRA
ncbi:MAG: hypothetical protein ACRC2H_01010 [Silanimonas sp.]